MPIKVSELREDFDEKKFDEEAQKSDHYCPHCHEWYKKQLLALLQSSKERTVGECDMCKKGQHHPTEHIDNVPLDELKAGAVVFVRAKVIDADIGDFNTTVNIKEYCDYRHKWQAYVNSVDVFPAEALYAKEK